MSNQQEPEKLPRASEYSESPTKIVWILLGSLVLVLVLYMFVGR